VQIVFVRPNAHRGGAEIAGTRPPAWGACLTRAPKGAGSEDIRFIDAMTDHVDHTALRALLAALAPDVVGTTALTPAIHEAVHIGPNAQQQPRAPMAARLGEGGGARDLGNRPR
jgi:anaerobic magnesium-protoporphyrin IX monomethyl ester cyclase